jgi:hypothetical protein
MIREIIKPDKEQLTINIPREYIHKEVEILIFPILEEENKPTKKSTSENLVEFKELMERAAKSGFKVPKDVDIDNLIDEINNDLY